MYPYLDPWLLPDPASLRSTIRRTISGLSKRSVQGKVSRDKPKKIVLRQSIPLSPRQEALYRLNNGNVISTTLIETLDYSVQTLEALASTWHTISRNIPVLRTRIQTSEDGVLGQVVQLTANNIAYGLHASSRENPNNGALLEVLNEDGKGIVVLHIHHALIDRSSLALLKRDFLHCFWGYAPKATPSTDAYIKHLSMKDPQSAMSYWQQNYLNNGEPSSFYGLPNERQSLRLETVEIAHELLYDSLLKFADQYDMRLHDLFYAAWALVAHKHAQTHQSTCFVIEDRDRTFFKHESAIGLIDEKFPLLLSVSGDIDVFSWLAYVKNAVAEASCNAFVGYTQILDAIHLNRPQTRLSVRLHDDGHDVMTDDDDFACELPFDNPIGIKTDLA